jgi:hypothetical protein
MFDFSTASFDVFHANACAITENVVSSPTLFDDSIGWR